MKRISHFATARDKLLHIETEGAVVNIQVGLTDNQGRRVTSVEILPDRYVGEEWHLDGQINTRVIEGEPTADEKRREGIVRAAALAFLHGDDSEAISLKDLADALGVPFEDVEAICEA